MQHLLVCAKALLAFWNCKLITLFNKKKFFLVSESFSSVPGYIWAAEFESVVRFFPSRQTFRIYAVVYAISKNTCVMASGKIFYMRIF